MEQDKTHRAEVPGATLVFIEYQRDGVYYLEFDATGTPCPVPMVNAMAGLAQVAGREGRLVMINGFEPQGLYDKVRGCFTWEVEALTGGGVRVEFRAVSGRSQEVDFSDTGCSG